MTGYPRVVAKDLPTLQIHMDEKTTDLASLKSFLRKIAMSKLK
jgi:hypothetical protein